MAYQGKHLPKKDKKVKDKQKTPGKAFLVAIVVLLVLVILFCAALIIINSYMNKIDRVDENIDVVAPENQDFETDKEIDPSLSVTDADDIEWHQTESLQDADLINIMLVGQDSRGNTRERSDTMILVSINPNTGEVAMVSFLRDLYVQIPGYYDNRMNAAYAFGGFPLLYEVMEVNFGITCDGGIEVNFEGFKDIVDVVGGVDVELTYRESEVVGTYVEGVNHLDGEQALTYARIRKLDSDFGRTNRQRTVLQAILNKVRHLSVTELFSLVNTCMEFVTTDMTNAEILDIAKVTLPLLSNLELQSYRIPTDDAYYMTMIREMSVLVPDLELCQKYLKEDFLPFD
ncbi:MAG: LCP family protein [Oscillospiraceae bacterium]|nr:LCP family protein [Oscillospiraceae bacterium]